MKCFARFAFLCVAGSALLSGCIRPAQDGDQAAGTQAWHHTAPAIRHSVTAKLHADVSSRKAGKSGKAADKKACETRCKTQCKKEAGFVPLFDGKTFDGWHKVGGDAKYEIVKGEIVGTCKNTRANTFMRTDKTYGDFEFRCQFKWDKQSNSGIQYRSQQRKNKQGKAVGRVYGYQYELDPSKRSWSGGLYEEARRGWLYNLKGDKQKHKREAIKHNDWNDVVIRCEGPRLQTWLNGVAIVDYTDKDKKRALAKGFIALQVHSGKEGAMRWRNLRIKEIKPKPNQDAAKTKPSKTEPVKQ